MPPYHGSPAQTRRPAQSPDKPLRPTRGSLWLNNHFPIDKNKDSPDSSYYMDPISLSLRSQRQAQAGCPTPPQTANQGPTYGRVFLKMTNMAADDRMPATTAKAMKRFNEMLPEKNSITKMAKTSVSTSATSKMPFFLFMIQ